MPLPQPKGDVFRSIGSKSEETLASASLQFAKRIERRPKRKS